MTSLQYALVCQYQPIKTRVTPTRYHKMPTVLREQLFTINVDTLHAARKRQARAPLTVYSSNTTAQLLPPQYIILRAVFSWPHVPKGIVSMHPPAAKQSKAVPKVRPTRGEGLRSPDE